MIAERREAIRQWRDAQLHVAHGDEGAAGRLAQPGQSLADVVRAALAIEPQPTEDELEGVDVQGHPLDPLHTWWGYRGPCHLERQAIARGLPWPPG